MKIFISVFFLLIKGEVLSKFRDTTGVVRLTLVQQTLVFDKERQD